MKVFYKTSQDHSHDSLKIVNFSDCIVRALSFLDSEDYADNMVMQFIHSFVVEISCLSSIQFEIACWYNVFIRGGITHGPIYYNDEIIFGPALNKAYMLESKTAKYPRIIIDSEQIDLIEKIINTSKTKLDKLEYDNLELTAIRLQYWLLQDEKGTVFTDYFGNLIKGADLDFVTSHKKAIETGYNHATIESVKDKYKWLKDYHNYTLTGIGCAEIEITDKNISEFMIKDNVIPSIENSKITSFRFKNL